MSRAGQSGWTGVVLAALSLPAFAQYPGHVNTAQQETETHLRATAVLEYTGELPHPKATRLIPLAVWDGAQYQPGSLYLAQPAPLAVQAGTQYILKEEGKAQGFFNIEEAENLGGHWIGIGKFVTPPPPKPRPPAARHMPRVVRDYDPDKPHFAHMPADESSGSPGDSGTKAAPPVDPNRPTLHERPKSGSGDSGTSTASSPSASQPQVDPDRPHFSRRDEAPPSQSAADAPPSVDPNRPLLTYSAPTEQEKIDKSDAFVGVPDGMKQLAGVSDTRPPEEQSYRYSWANPEDAQKMKAALETIAEQALAPPAEAAKPAPVRKTGRTRKPPAAPPPAPALPVLADEQYSVFGLSFGGGATMVLSAHTTGDPVRYVTIIAQPDFYGQPQVLLKRVTSDKELEAIPRMRLVDAMDTQGNGRADLIFELRGRSWRQFAIYRIAGGTAMQVFATPSMGL